MDKKKVKKSIEQAMDEIIFIGIKHPRLEKQIEEIKECLSEAKEELFKLDWISVEDELPLIGEKVLACDKEMEDYPFVTVRHSKDKEGDFLDKNGFILGLNVTHWHKIDKLEV